MRAPDEPQPRTLPRPSTQPGGPARFPVLHALVVAVLGLSAGLGATRFVLDRSFDPTIVHAGPWSAIPGIGTPNIDPYARAILARTGTVPLAAAEGLALSARVDSGGRPLRGGCHYTVGGAMPPARAWTLAATDADGRAIDNAAERYGFGSATVLRSLDGGFAIEVSPEARPGNWLPVRAQAPFVLTLRLYDTPLGTAAAVPAGASLPAIDLRDCAAP